MEEKKTRKNDTVLIIGILIVVCALFAGMKFYQAKTTKDGVVAVTVDGTLYGTYPLDTDMEEKIEQKDGSYNLLIIKDGKADVTDASCRDKICVDHRPIDKNGESIVCLPNKVVASVENGSESEVDSATD